jgi:hydrogenase maturation protease
VKHSWYQGGKGALHRAAHHSLVRPLPRLRGDGGTSTQELLGDLEDLDHLIVLDAVSSGSAPGAMIRLEGAQVPQAFTTRFSPHQVGIADLLAMLTFTGHAPKRVLVLGVEPAVLKLGMELSGGVAARVPALCEQVVAELRQLGLSPTQRLSEVA